MDKIFLCLILPVFCCLALSPAAAAQLELGGYYENTLAGLQPANGRLSTGDLNRLRLKFDLSPSKILAVRIQPSYTHLFSSADLPLTSAANLDQIVIEQAYGKVYLPVFNFTAGKQRIAWGSGYIWNPTDIFNPFVLSFATNVDDEANVKALRLEMPWGEASGADSYITLGSTWSETRKGLRARTNIGLFDLSASAVDWGGTGWQLGFDTAGELGEIGLRAEAAWKFPRSLASYLQIVLGGSHTLADGLGLDLEYFYNGAAAPVQGGYKDRNYLFGGLNKLVDELTEIRLSALANLDDASFFLYPAIKRNAAPNLDLSLEALLAGGPSGGEFNSVNLLLARIGYSF